MAPEDDTPRSAFRALSWRMNLAVVAVLVALSGVAWVHTARLSTSMRGMVMGLAQVGTLAQGSMSVALFLAMWATMMAAMMLPSAAPMVLAHLAVERRRGGGALATIVFVGGYLVVWSLAGLLPFAAYLGIAALGDGAARSRLLPAASGLALMAAGAYQFTAAKQVCLAKCQSPFAFVLTHDFGGGATSALRAGVVHGAFCLGCCWALMSVLLVVGLMNLVWMAAIFVVVLVERTSPRGLAVARVAGSALLALGAAVVAYPAVLARIS